MRHEDSHHGDLDYSIEKYLIQTREFSCAVILADKGHGCRCEGIHYRVSDSFDVEGDGFCGNNVRREGIDRACNDDIRDRKERALKRHGQADAHDLGKKIPLDAQILQLQLIAFAAPSHQNGNNGDGGHVLREDGCVGNAVHRHMTYENEEEIEQDVNESARGKDIKRGFGITDGAKHRRAEIINRARGNAAADDDHIQNGLIVKDLLRSHQR